MDQVRTESVNVSTVWIFEMESAPTTIGFMSNGDYSDQHASITVNAPMTSATFVVLLFSVTALVALRRTKSIPKTACLLSSSLLLFDCATVFTFALRYMFDYTTPYFVITLVGVGWAIASFFNVAVMALDRLILFQYPFLYARRFTNGSYVVLYFIVIFIYVFVFTGHWITCFVGNPTPSDIRACFFPIIQRYMTFSQIGSVFICIPCLVWIAVIIRKQQQKVHSRSERNPTVVVFVCCINFILCTIGVFVVIYSVSFATSLARTAVTDVMHLINCLVDTFVYVLWFKECRHELLNIIATVIPPLRHSVQKIKNKDNDVAPISTGTSTVTPLGEFSCPSKN